MDQSVLDTPTRPLQSTNNPPTWLDTPNTANPVNHFEASNVRGSFDLGQTPTFTEPAMAEPPSSSVLGNGNGQYDDSTAHIEQNSFSSATNNGGLEHTTPSNPETVAKEKSTWDDNGGHEVTTEAYAMLKFNDSYCYVTSLNLVIVRDDKFLQDWKASEKEKRRRVRAQEALDQYALEPSQPSQPGDEENQDPSSRSGESLEGRPARGLLSNYSEQGGAVAYAAPSNDGEEVHVSRRRRRSSKANQNSSSANSVAPHNLHPVEGSEFLHTDNHYTPDGHLNDPREWAQLPVHTARPEDIKKISKEHLIFSYNSEAERWELKVIGNRAFVNGELYDKGNVVPLHHDDEIYIATVGMRFMLPDDVANAVDGDDIIESVETSSPLSTSPIGRLSHAMEGENSDDSNDAGDEGTGRRKPSIKLSLKKGRLNERRSTDPKKTSDSPEAGRKPTKAKKSKGPGGETEGEEAEKNEGSATSPPILPSNLDPNSTLAGLAPEELPEKRKGPGRPPKNGLVSKRDEAVIRKRTKEYEKRGENVPEYRVLLEQVRSENKMKDLATKAQARGEPVPDIPIASIETDRTVNVKNGPQQSADEKGHISGSPPAPERKTSPKPRRVVKSPSPIKPMSEFSEEELKKPNMTYIYIIDEILRNVEGGQADLQTIYDKIQKRWPYFKYKVHSHGWQSSVRHNLLSCPRFQEAGKSGKGKYWTLDDDHPLDKLKKRPTPPPRPQPFPNGRPPPSAPGMPAMQPYGQPTYDGPQSSASTHRLIANNGRAQAWGGTYYSPYGPSQPGMAANYRSPSQPDANGTAPMGQTPNGPYMRNGVQPSHPSQNSLNSPRPPNQQHPSQQEPQPNNSQPTPFQPVVDAIMNYRTDYLMKWPPNSADYSSHEETFKRGTQYFSNLFHGQPCDDITEVEVNQEPFTGIRRIFERYKHLFSNQNPATSSMSTAGGQDNVSTAHTESMSTSSMILASDGAQQALETPNTALADTNGSPAAAVLPTTPAQKTSPISDLNPVATNGDSGVSRAPAIPPSTASATPSNTKESSPEGSRSSLIGAKRSAETSANGEDDNNAKRQKPS